MSYRGWGIRDKIAGAVKSGFKAPARNRETAAIFRRAEDFQQQVQKLKLDQPSGIRLLADTMARQIIAALREAKGTDHLEELPEPDSLHFFSHLVSVIDGFLEQENLFAVPDALSGNRSVSIAETWEAEAILSKRERLIDDFDNVIGRVSHMFYEAVLPLTQSHPALLESPLRSTSEKDLTFTAPLSMVINELPSIAERILLLVNIPELKEDGTVEKLSRRLEHNLIVASGGMPGDPDTWPRVPKLPTRSQLADNPTALLDAYFAGTVWEKLFNYSVPISIPQSTRFEHHHMVAGSGHGKTQALQHLILHDLEQVAKGSASVVVMDSQGDLIRKISNLQQFAPGGPLSDRLVLIDPSDVEYPVALNLFDVGMERINQYSQLDRERMINGVLELYDFVLGSLLDAQMTQKQSVIFRYITRLMLHIPDATISTFRELLGKDGSKKYQPYIDKLSGSARDFFETEFDSSEFTQTKKQVLRRLWGILENQTFERMFLYPRSKLDLFTEMNSGKVILINTAKDLLKEDGTEFLGRFFIAMIAQAAQERSAIADQNRMPTFVYIDEAADYFDRNIGIILSQARKYKVGMVLAHQFLGQLDSKLQESVFANTSIKFAGGVSSKDARSLAAEMRTDARFIESIDRLEFAAFIRGTTKNAVSIRIPVGQLERMPRMSAMQMNLLREQMREQYAVHIDEATAQSRTRPDGSGDDDPDGGDINPKSNPGRPPPSDEPQEW